MRTPSVRKKARTVTIIAVAIACGAAADTEERSGRSSGKAFQELGGAPARLAVELEQRLDRVSRSGPGRHRLDGAAVDGVNPIERNSSGEEGCDRFLVRGVEDRGRPRR